MLEGAPNTKTRITMAAAVSNENQEDPPSETSSTLSKVITKMEKYLEIIKERAYSTIIVPLLATAASLILTGHFSTLRDWMLVPFVKFVFTIVGTTIGIGLGLGLATHVHDVLESWHQNEENADDNKNAKPGRNSRSTSHNTLLRNSTHNYQDETSYAAFMSSAGYDVSDGLLRGQIVKSQSSAILNSPNYEYTHVPEEEQYGPRIMKQQWPHLPSCISHEIGRWMEHIVRDYVAIWYTMIDPSCPFMYEQEYRRQQDEKTAETKKVNGNESTNGDHATLDAESQSSQHDATATASTSATVDREMITTLSPHRSRPLMTAMYHSLALVLGNMSSRMEHVNVFSLLLLKFTKVLALKLKTFRELRLLALEKQGGVVVASSSIMSSSTRTATSPMESLQHDHDSTITFDEHGNNVSSTRRKKRRHVSEMTMAKEFLLAGKLHKAITFGMDVPSLLFADTNGKECYEDEDLSQEELLERRLLDSGMMTECEADYNRVLGHRLCRALLPRSEFSSPIIRTIMTELLGTCILSPIMGCFAPDYVNSWISTGLEAVVVADKNTTGETTNGVVGTDDRTWDYDESTDGMEMEVDLQLDSVFAEEGDDEDGLNEAIEVIRNSTDPDEDDERGLNASRESEHNDEPGHDSQTVSGDYILPLLTMAVIDLQRYVDFDLARDESVDPEEIGTNWDDEECQGAVRQVVLVIEAALIHGRRRQRLTKRKPSTADEKDNQGDTLLPFFSSNLSQVLMELTSDIDAFETRIAVQETRLKNDENGEGEKSNGPSTSCQPSMSELSTLRTLIAAWLHTGQVYKMLSVLIQARQSILVPYFNDDAFLRNSENSSGFVCQLKALDRVEMMVDTSSILSSTALDANGNASTLGKSSPKKKRLSIQAWSPTGGNSASQPSPRLMAGSLSQSVAKGGERLQRFISGGSMAEESSEYGSTLSASMTSLASSTEGPTPRYLDFHRNRNFAQSLRAERERRKESWQHVSASMADQSLKIVHKVKGSTEEDMEDHRDLHRLSRTFYTGTNTVGLKDGTRRKDPVEEDANSSGVETEGQDIENEVIRVSLLTVEMVGAKRRIEIPDDDSSFLIRAQPRPLKAVGMHIDQRNHGQTYKTFAATYEEAALPSGSFRYSGGRYIRRCTLKYYPNDRTATIELPSSEVARTLDSRKATFGPPTQISVGPPKARPLSGDFLRKHHLCQKWVPRGAAPRSGSSILASPTMEPTDFHSVPRAGKSIDFVYRMSLFEPPMVELSGKKFTVHDSSVLGAHRADASSMELSDASLSIALLTAGQDWEHQLSQIGDDGTSHKDETDDKKIDPGVEMGPDGYPIVWIKLHKKQGEHVTTEIKPYRASYMRAALLLSSARQEAQRQCLVMCVKAGSARNATRARVDSLLKPAQRLLEFATSTSREKQSILMRDLKLGINHVDREQLRRNKLLYPRHPTNIRSLSATVEEYLPAKDTGISFPGSSPTTTVYKIRCVAIVELVDTDDDDVDLSDYASADGSCASVFREEWVVYRQFRDFNTLHKHLKTQVAVNETSGTASSRLVGAATAAFTVGGAPTGSERHRKGLIPSLGQAQKAGALGLTQKAIEKRRTILHSYLQHFMTSNHPLRYCTEILTFLGAFHPFPAGTRTGDAPSETPDGLGRVGMVRTVFEDASPNETVEVSVKSERIVVSSPPKSVEKKPRSFSAASDTLSSPSLHERESLRSKSIRMKPDDMPLAIKAKIDKVPLAKVRQSIFELIRAQFDFENASFFRNRLLTAIKTMSFAVATNGGFRETLYNAHTSHLNPEAIADLIKMGLDLLWPDGIFFTSSPPLTPEQSLELSEKAKDLLTNAFPDQLRSILGNEITDDGLEMLHEMLQNRVILKSLFYMFVDLLLLEVFPEFQDFLTGGSALE